MSTAALSTAVLACLWQVVKATARRWWWWCVCAVGEVLNTLSLPSLWVSDNRGDSSRTTYPPDAGAGRERVGKGSCCVPP